MVEGYPADAIGTANSPHLRTSPHAPRQLHAEAAAFGQGLEKGFAAMIRGDLSHDGETQS